MTVTLIVLAIVGALMLLLLRSYQRRRLNIAGVEEIPSYTHPVHVPALLNLLDEHEEHYLRCRLPRAECNSILRRRIRVVLQYVGRIAVNAAVLQQVGDAARHSNNPDVAKAAKELATLALQTRMFAFLARIQLLAGLLLLRCPSRVKGAVDKYMTVVEKTERLVRLQYPHKVHAISAQL